MGNCCKYSFGSYPHNFDLVLDNLFANADGIYTVIVDLFGGSKKTIDLDLKNGDEIIIPQGELNEQSIINFQVLDIHKIPMEMDGCANFTLTTYINVNLKCNDNNCDLGDYTPNPYGGYLGDS